MESSQTTNKNQQVTMDAEVLDLLIGTQDYTERLHKYSSKLQVMKVSEGYEVTNISSNELIVILDKGPKDIVKNHSVLSVPLKNKIMFMINPSQSSILTHNEFMWLSCQPEISFVYSNGKINAPYNEDEMKGMDIYTLFSKLEFQPTSKPDTDNDDDDWDPFDDLLSDLEDDEPDDGTVQIIYQQVSDMEYIYSDEDEEYLTDEEFEEISAELAVEEAEEANKNFNLTIAEYKKACCGGTLAEACIKELLEKVVDNLIKTELNTKLHKYSNSLQATNLFIFDHGDPVTQGYKVRNISNETVYIKGARLGKNEDTYKMLRLTTDGNVEFILQANDEFLMNPDEFIWLCLQPEIAFEFSNTYLRDPMVTDKTQNIAYEIIKNNFRLF